jgi:ribosomal protein L11 methyltransferase
MKLRASLRKISVATSSEAADAVTELLARVFNTTPSTYFDLEKETTTISVYCPETALPAEAREKISNGLKRIENCGLNIGPGKISISKMRQEDWAESWKRHFKPIGIGNTLLVKPGWSRKKASAGQAVVILDPGLSFGTGQHPTTLFCLRQIVKHRPLSKASAAFLDLGTGSGILAIAAAKLGYQPIHAIDFDPDAVRIARANAQKNHVIGRIHIARGDVSKLRAKPGRCFDVVCANLISTLLIAERKKIVAQLDSGGTLILAGILNVEFVLVQKAYEQCGLKLVAARTEKEWRSGAFRG